MRMSERPRLDFQIDPSALPTSAVDLAGTVLVCEAASGQPRFTGEISSAQLIGGLLSARAMSGLELSDVAVPKMVSFGLTPQERVKTLVRHAGFGDDKFRLEGFTDPQEEYFEVLFP